MISIEKTIDDIGSFARGLVYGNPALDQIRTRGGVEPDQVVEAAAEALHHELGAEPACVPLQIILFKTMKR